MEADGGFALRIARGASSRAWFIDPKTRMNPNLGYAQAIHGRFTGRGTGIIDTIHLVEVARAAEVLPLSKADREDVKRWFAEYIAWMTTHRYGLDERDAKNNHATCWVMQVAAFAHLTGDQPTLAYCRTRFKTVLVPDQMAADGSFPSRDAAHQALRVLAVQPGSDVGDRADSIYRQGQSLELRAERRRGLRRAVGPVPVHS